MFLIEKVKQYRKVPKESENFSSLLFTHPHSWCCFPSLTVFFYVKKVHIYQHTVPHMIRFKLTSKPGRLAPHSLNVCSFTQVFVRYLPWAGHRASEGAWPCPDLRHQVQINSTCKNSYCLLRLTLFFPSTFNLFILCWGRTDEQYSGSFRWTVKGLSHTYTCIHSPPNSPPIQAAT